jgi:adenosylcobinamide kinase/adenosylcobinamide-phosphate guanylyltransferase
MGKVTLITGGARSGKSFFALEYAEGIGEKRIFAATAQAHDAEMVERIHKHKLERGKDWDVLEEPLEISSWLNENASKYDVVLLDCLTLWLTNVMLSETHDLEAEVESLLGSFKNAGCSIVAVSNEVGMGIVPENALAREFRDHAGRLNRLVAELASEVYLVVSGIPVKIKPSGSI